jgi:cytoskeletal protein RodZ
MVWPGGWISEVKKILQSENQPDARQGLSLRSVLLLVLLVSVGAGATAYALGTAFAASTGSSATSQQITSTTSTTTGAHNCTLASLALTAA